jgi:F0F1-type ATP synthase epsilon subunit
LPKQADLLTEAAVRERQIDARKRRRERDKWAKQLAQLDGNGSEVSNDQQPSTSGVTV